MTTDQDRRAAELRAAGKSWGEIARELEGESLSPEQEAQQQELGRIRQNLSSGQTYAPGKEPESDPVESMMRDYQGVKMSGGRESEAVAAGLQRIFTAAVAGDKRVVASADEHPADTRHRWLEEKKQRAIRAGRDRTFGPVS